MRRSSSRHADLQSLSKSPNAAPPVSGLRRKVLDSGRKRRLEQNEVIGGGKDTQENGSSAETPVIKVSSLADRFKRTLRNNVRRTPSPVRKRLRQRAEQIRSAAEEMSEIQKEATEFFGLSRHVGEVLLKHKGIDDLYDWQKECLRLPAVAQKKNLIYSLPTSGGKTLVAEILILKELLVKKRNAILILPYVSIVQEKMKNLAGLSVELDFAVEEYAGSKGLYPPRIRFKRRSVYVCTIEKCNTLVSILVEAGRMAEVGLVVADELHMIGDGERGATFELALTKLLHCAPTTQIIAMSATLSNIDELQKFLDAELYTNDFRPVSLTEFIKVEEGVYRIPEHNRCMDEEEPFQLARVVKFQYTPEMTRVDPDHLLGLLLEVVPGNSCLVFCPTKKNCENVADMLSKLMSKDFHHERTAEKRELLRALKENGNSSICPILKRTVPYGLAYHHSGLTMDERKLIEEAYSVGTLCALMCTSTLAAGVNLPAKRVILRSIKVGLQTLSRSQYKQMTGRAGRAGIDTSGESILLVKSSEKSQVRKMVTGPCDRCQSSLLDHGAKALRTLLLGMVGLKVATSAADSLSFLSRTLAAVQLFSTNQETADDLRTITQNALQELLNSGLIKQRMPDLLDVAEEPNSQTSLEVTKLGKATFKSGIDITRSRLVYDDLCKARESLNVAGYLHLIYLATPYDMADQCRPSWMVYVNRFCALSESDQELAALIGVTEAYLHRRAAGRSSRQTTTDFVVKRFYLSMMLYELWQEKSVWEVAEKFEQNRGFVQNLLTGASSFASAIYHFCKELEEFWAYQDLLGNFVKRLSFCASAELIPLMEIPGVKQTRARQLYRAGFTTLALVASAGEDEMINRVEHLNRKGAREIIVAAKMLLTEKVEALRDEATELLQIVMPLEDKENTKPHSEVPESKTIPAHPSSDNQTVAMGSDLSNGNAHDMNNYNHDTLRSNFDRNSRTEIVRPTDDTLINHDKNSCGNNDSYVSDGKPKILASVPDEKAVTKLVNCCEEESLCDRTLTDDELLRMCERDGLSSPLFTESSCQSQMGGSSCEMFTSLNESHSALFAEDEEMFTEEILAKLDPT